MRRLFYILLGLVFCISCDDGDVITINLDFDKQLERCGDEDTDNYVLYDIKTDPNESLTLLFPSSSANNAMFNPQVSPFEGNLSINGSSVRFNYRIYDGNPADLICQEIPSSTVNIIEDYEASHGTVNYVSTFVDDDNDDVPSILEDLNGNGDLEDDDSDGDGIPNYIDEDDDGDNVPTKDENPDPDNNGELSDAQNTDGTDLPDYLDTDDDNDGIITRYEDENLNGNLFDDFGVAAILPRFLDPDNSETFINDNLNPNSFRRTVSIFYTILNVDIEILSSDSIEFGTLELEIDN
jgi:hypothetical protein